MRTPPNGPQSQDSSGADKKLWQEIASLAAQMVERPGDTETALPRGEARTTTGRAREWAPFAASDTRRHDRHRRPPLVAAVILLCGVLISSFGVVLLHLNQQSNSTPAKPPGSSAISRSGSESGQLRHIDAKAAVLTTHELPGYVLISSAEATRPGGGAQPSSWDNLFQRSSAGAAEYRITEAIVVVYGAVADAAANVDRLSQVEEEQGAKASAGLATDQSTTWVEPIRIPGYTLIRVVLRKDNVVAQVALLGKDDPLLAHEVQDLAGAQQARLVSLFQASG